METSDFAKDLQEAGRELMAAGYTLPQAQGATTAPTSGATTGSTSGSTTGATSAGRKPEQHEEYSEAPEPFGLRRSPRSLRIERLD